MRRTHLTAIPLVILASSIAGCGSVEHLAGRVRAALDPREPSVGWPVSDPATEQMDPRALDRLGRDLAASGTKSFLVARHGRIVYEWSAWNAGPNRRHDLAAMAKPIVGVNALLVAMTDRRLELDTPVSRFVAGWADDPVRSKIRVRELVTHTSGLDNVSFPAGARRELDGWAQRYYDDPAGRFRMAISEVPLLFAPGTDHRYSGVGYYVLAYVFGRVLPDGPEKDLATLLRHRIFEPLGIPDEAWRISYDRTYDVDGMKLQACGSGSQLTARAVARIATLVAQKGRWNGQQLIDAAAIEDLLGQKDSRPVSINPGWWVNWWGEFPSLPPDALVGWGGGDQIVLAAPSLGLVMVRIGDALAQDGEASVAIVEEHLFRPLMQSVHRSSSPGTPGT